MPQLRLYTSFISLLFFASLVSEASAYGSDGHRVITKVALELASESARDFARNLLDDEDFVEASNWADSKAAESKYTNSGEFHFSHTPYRVCGEFVYERDCGFRQSGRCLVTGLSQFLSIVINPYLDRVDRQEALKFILHLMGDIHQPLHTGFAEDAGGTGINITDHLTLHEVWDFDIISRYKSVMKPPKWESIAQKIIDMLRKNPQIGEKYPLTSRIDAFLESRESAFEYAAFLASETATTVTCKYAYRDENGTFIENFSPLGPSYYKSKTPGVLTMLVKAGVRLAALLDAISTEYRGRKLIKKQIELEERIARKMAEQNETTLAPTIGPTSNRYAVLQIDFDPETIVMQEENPESCPEVVCKPKRFKPRPASPDILSICEGVDLSSIVLIRRRGEYIVTDKRLVVSHKYNPLKIIVFQMRFNSTGEVKFNFDMAAFPVTMSDNLAIRSVLKLKGMNIAVSDPIDDFISGGAIERESMYKLGQLRSAQVARPGFTVAVSPAEESQPELREARVKLTVNIMDSLKAEHASRKKELEEKYKTELFRKFDSIGRYMESELKARRGQIIFFEFGNIKMFTLIDTLRTPDRLRFYFVPIRGGLADRSGLLIDPAVFDGYFTEQVATVLKSVEKSNRALTKKHSKTRPTILKELSDLCMVFFGSDPDRMAKREIVVELMVYPGDDRSNYLVFEWGITYSLNQTNI